MIIYRIRLRCEQKVRACNDDFIREALENNERKGRDAVYPDQNIPDQPRADHAAEAQRKRQHAYDRSVLQNTEMQGRGRDGVYRRMTKT